MKRNTPECSKCKRIVGKNGGPVIDNKQICVACFYDNIKPVKIYPIGVVRNGLKRSVKGFGTVGEGGLSRIELLPSQKPFMHRLEEERYLSIVYYLHETKDIRSVFNRGLDGKKVGIFASRTPDRPSRIAVQDVELVRINGTAIYVKGLDAIDGSPVLDIKMKWN